MERTLKQVIEGDFRYEGTSEDAQQYLKKIKYISKHVEDADGDVPLELLEKLFIMLQKKYPITMQWINLTLLDDEKPWYTLSIKHSETHEWLKTVYGMTIYEVFVKIVLFTYAYTRKL